MLGRDSGFSNVSEGVDACSAVAAAVAKEAAADKRPEPVVGPGPAAAEQVAADRAAVGTIAAAWPCPADDLAHVLALRIVSVHGWGLGGGVIVQVQQVVVAFAHLFLFEAELDGPVQTVVALVSASAFLFLGGHSALFKSLLQRLVSNSVSDLATCRQFLPLSLSRRSTMSITSRNSPLSYVWLATSAIWAVVGPVGSLLVAFLTITWTDEYPLATFLMDLITDLVVDMCKT
ncbi:hypothetical protein OGAPHI_005497 [Ogataea philodendri]|uniref:Uncharacterized protein n=1 Tax=Ogataea philodendri TaxID=1378263 RepID=A0A9P8P061_9ASCO|nr:uncharacterized protein OGAPHI_005497 [Ogataea philodendri]KAH3662249.1 hypothetical protein OGAPHI_005497 [Ogataea philodendri]